MPLTNKLVEGLHRVPLNHQFTTLSHTHSSTCIGYARDQIRSDRIDILLNLRTSKTLCESADINLHKFMLLYIYTVDIHLYRLIARSLVIRIRVSGKLYPLLTCSS